MMPRKSSAVVRCGAAVATNHDGKRSSYDVMQLSLFFYLILGRAISYYGLDLEHKQFAYSFENRNFLCFIAYGSSTAYT